MFKKLLALAAVACIGSSMNAKVVEDMYVDWTSMDWHGYVMGYIPQTSAEEGLIFDWPHFNYEKVEDGGANPNGYEVVSINGEDHYVVPTEDGGPKEDWGIQAHLLPANVNTEAGLKYTVTVCAKANKDDVNFGLPLSWSWSGGTCEGSITVGTEWEEHVLEYADEVGGASCWLVGQMYDNEARVCIKWLKITHEEGEQAETEWIEHLVNGDAEGEYGDVVCAVSKISDGEITPCEIVDDGGNKVFIVRAGSVEDREDDARAWANQFWICSEKNWNVGDQFRISFRYKATNVANCNTQSHDDPGAYLIWHCLGDVKFTTEWQEYSKVITVESDMANMRTIAFNLNTEQLAATDFYFDDLKWETMKLDEGYFIAGDFNDNNLAEAVEMIYNDEEMGHVAVVGSIEKPASKIKISKVRGNNSAFNNNTLVANTEGEDIVDGGVYELVKKAAASIILPYGANWKVVLYEDYDMIMFEDVTSGIKFVSADNNAPVRYYNIQGVEVKNPVAGQLYIIKAGNKTFKAIMR